MGKHSRVVFVAMLTGCGLTMTHGPDPNRPRDQRPVCTESMEAPTRDGIGAVLGLVTIFTGVVFSKYSDSNAEVGPPLIIGGVVVMAASYASGGVGYYRVKRCRKAIAEFDQQGQMQVRPPVASGPGTEQSPANMR